VPHCQPHTISTICTVHPFDSRKERHDSTHPSEGTRCCRGALRSVRRTRSVPYVESQAHEEVVHFDKAASELVGPVRHDIWDVPIRRAAGVRGVGCRISL
jgi:hypothetical protein